MEEKKIINEKINKNMEKKKRILKVLLFFSPALVFLCSFLIYVISAVLSNVTFNFPEDLLISLVYFFVPLFIPLGINFGLYVLSIKVNKYWSNILFLTIFLVFYGFAIYYWGNYFMNLLKFNGEFNISFFPGSVVFALILAVIFFTIERIINMIKIKKTADRETINE